MFSVSGGLLYAGAVDLHVGEAASRRRMTFGRNLWIGPPPVVRAGCMGALAMERGAGKDTRGLLFGDSRRLELSVFPGAVSNRIVACVPTPL